jgi:hypothetical protein
VSGHRPLLELLVAPAPAPVVVQLVHQLRRWCDPRSTDPALPAPAARLATSAAAYRQRPRGDATPVPVAVWAETDVEAEELGRAGAVVVTRPDVAARVDGAIALPTPNVDARRFRYTTPFVRSRLRRRFALPADLVVEIGRPGAPSLEGDLIEAALAAASVAIVTGPWALAAMAAGVPLVLDPPTATSVEATDGVHAIVAGNAVARSAADAVAHDLSRATRLSRAARQHVVECHDIATASDRVAVALGLVDRRADPAARLQHRLRELATPDGATPARRAAAALATLGPSNAAAVAARVW